MKTIYHLQMLDFENKGSCAVVSFDFQAVQDGGGTSVVKKGVDLNACLDFALTDHSGEKTSPFMTKIFDDLQEDCSVSTHYSLQAKKVLAKPSH